jgi:hypothetical protein
MSKRYGNDRVYCFLEEGWENARHIEIWHCIGIGLEEVMAHATDRWNAMQIVDALITAENVKDDGENKFTKRQIQLLEFVAATSVEPYTTMANNALLWEDQELYTTVKAKIQEIY